MALKKSKNKARDKSVFQRMHDLEMNMILRLGSRMKDLKIVVVRPHSRLFQGFHLKR